MLLWDLLWFSVNTSMVCTLEICAHRVSWKVPASRTAYYIHIPSAPSFLQTSLNKTQAQRQNYLRISRWQLYMTSCRWQLGQAQALLSMGPYVTAQVTRSWSLPWWQYRYTGKRIHKRLTLEMSWSLEDNRPHFLLPKLKFSLVYQNIIRFSEYNTKWGRKGKKWYTIQRPSSSCLLQCNMLLKCAKSLQLCPTLFDPMDCESTGSSICGISQGRILEWVAMPSSRGSSWPRDWTHISYVSCIGRWVL